MLLSLEEIPPLIGMTNHLAIIASYNQMVKLKLSHRHQSSK